MQRRNLNASIAVIVALVLSLALTACQSQSGPSLIGTWSISMGGQPSSGGATWQFTQDGKMIQKGAGVQQATASYTLSGNTLTLMSSAKGASAPSTMTIQWISNDQFKAGIAGMGSNPLTFTRQK